MRAISFFLIQCTIGRVLIEESDSDVHRVNGFGQNAEWHVGNFCPTKIRTTSPAAAIFHSSAVGGYKMRSP